MPKTVLMQQQWKDPSLFFTGISAEDQGKEMHPAGLRAGLVPGWPPSTAAGTEQWLREPTGREGSAAAGKGALDTPYPNRRRQLQPTVRKGLRRLRQGQRLPSLLYRRAITLRDTALGHVRGFSALLNNQSLTTAFSFSKKVNPKIHVHKCRNLSFEGKARRTR